MKFFKKIQDKEIKVNLILFLNLIFFGFLFFWRLMNLETHPQVGLDPSWQWYMSYAQLNGLVFGKDVIFTWGPLAFLETGICLSSFQVVLYLFFSIFKIGLFLLCLYKIRFKLFSGNKGFYFCLTCICLVYGRFIANTEIGYLALVIVLFSVIQLNQSNTFIYKFLFCLLFFLGIFIKLTLAVEISIIMLLWILNGLSPTIEKIKLIIGTGIFSILLIISTSNISFYNYFLNSIEVIRGYAEVMVLNNCSRKQNFDFILFGLTFVFVLFYSSFNRFKFNIVNTFLVLVLVGIIFRSSYTRFDYGHAVIFVAVIPFILIILKAIGVQLKRYWEITFFCISLCMVFNFSSGSDISNLASRVYLKYDSQLRLKNNFVQSGLNNEQALNKKIRNKYGKVLLIADELTPAYTDNQFLIPPTPQNFCTYTDKLDSINHAFYLKSNTSFICVESNLLIRGIDNRHPYLFNRWFFSNLYQFSLIDSFTIGKAKYSIFESCSSNKIVNSAMDNAVIKDVKQGQCIPINNILKECNTSNNPLISSQIQNKDSLKLYFEIITIDKSVMNKLLDFTIRLSDFKITAGNFTYTIPGYYKLKPLPIYPNLNRFVSGDSFCIDGRFKTAKIRFFLRR
jgi:hypothetical protein